MANAPLYTMLDAPPKISAPFTQLNTHTQTSQINEAARIAHDISSPIATIEMCLFMLSQEMPAEKLLIMKSALQNVRDISNKLLDKYRADQSSNCKQAILLTPIIKHVISLKKYEWAHQPHELATHFSLESMSLKVKGTTTDLKRLISNLLNNALESCHALPIIQIQLEVIGKKARLSITDNGIGMNNDQLHKYLLGLSTKHQGKGLGLSSAAEYMNSIDAP